MFLSGIMTHDKPNLSGVSGSPLFQSPPGKPGEFYFRKLFRFSLAISDNEIILLPSDTSLTHKHNTHRGRAMSSKKVKPLEVKKLDNDRMAVRFSDKPKKWIILDDPTFIQFVIYRMIDG